MAFELGRTYSMYEFLDVLRTSRSTAAYRVRNTLARRQELLEVLLESAQDDQEQVERFMREVAVRASLVHTNIVTFHNAFVLEGRFVMTTELVEGPTVAERLEAGPLEWREAAGIARQALAALAYAHERDVVHRDISPRNIVLANGVAKLANFSLAKSVYSPQLTLAGAIVGNPRYISPEQVRGTGELDARSDIYSLGAVLYEMLCGVPPFDSKSQFEMMLAHVNGAVTPPSEIDENVPAQLDAIVLKALAKRPSERYQTAQEFTASLEAAAGGASPWPAAASHAASGSNGVSRGLHSEPAAQPHPEPHSESPMLPPELSFVLPPEGATEPHSTHPQLALAPLLELAARPHPEPRALPWPDLALALPPELAAEPHSELAALPQPEPSLVLPDEDSAEPQPTPPQLTLANSPELAAEPPALPQSEPSCVLPAELAAESHSELAEVTPPQLTLAPALEFASEPDAEPPALSQSEPSCVLPAELAAESHSELVEVTPPQLALAPALEFASEPDAEPPALSQSEPSLVLPAEDSAEPQPTPPQLTLAPSPELASEPEPGRPRCRSPNLRAYRQPNSPRNRIQSWPR